jgi:glycosyltransferase involved in cell wall biosynthesis
MKVLLTCIAHFWDQRGGEPRIVHDEATELRRRRDDVWVLARGKLGQPEYEINNGIHLLRYVPAKVAPWNPARSSGHQEAAKAVLARHLSQVDAIHGHSPLSYLAALDTYGNSVHSSYTIHSPARMEMAIVWKNSGLLRRITAPAGLAAINRMEEACLRRSGVITALSQYTIDCIARIHGEKLARTVRLLPGWVDTSQYVPVENREQAKRQLGWPTDIPVLFTLRRLSPRMGLDLLLDASCRLRNEGIRFHLMVGGSGPLRSKLEEQSKTLGLSNAVTFMGQISDEKLPLAYAACDAFVLPTAALECFGLIALEALSAGRPVLATPVGAIPEIIGKFDPSWLSQSAAVDDIADLLRRFFEGRLAVHSPAQLHELAHRHYSRDSLVPAYIETVIGCATAKDNGQGDIARNVS